MDGVLLGRESEAFEDGFAAGLSAHMQIDSDSLEIACNVLLSFIISPLFRGCMGVFFKLGIAKVAGRQAPEAKVMCDGAARLPVSTAHTHWEEFAGVGRGRGGDEVEVSSDVGSKAAAAHRLLFV